MKLYSGKRIGQSAQEFTAAAVFSFFLHLAFLLTALFLYTSVAPRRHVPPFYDVKLVAELNELPAPSVEPPPALPKPPEKALPKKAGQKELKLPAKKGDMPELAKQKAKPEETQREQQQMPASVKTESVAVTTSQKDFKYPYYFKNVIDKITPNWQPLKGSSHDAQARVIFTINRSGWLMNVYVDEEHSTGNFELKQAAIRAIRLSSPFPPLPEEFSKQTLEFSVDLTPKE